MRIADLRAGFDAGAAAREMRALIEELYPICRSITGEGLRATLRAVKDRVPIELHEVPSGTPVFDWTVPDEWNISDAYVLDARGTRVIDFRRSNLHVVNYSEPVRAEAAPRRAQAAPLQPAGSSRLDSLPDVLLRAQLGLLREPAAARRAPGGRVRGGDRVAPRAGLADLRRAAACRASRRKRSSSPATAATPRSPTTTCPGSRSRPPSPARCPP